MRESSGGLGRHGVRDHVVTVSSSWRERGAPEAVHLEHAPRARGWRKPELCSARSGEAVPDS